MGFRFYEISQQSFSFEQHSDQRNIELNVEDGIDQEPGNYFSFFNYYMWKQRCVTIFYLINCAPFSNDWSYMVCLFRWNELIYRRYAFYFMHVVINRFVLKYEKKSNVKKKQFYMKEANKYNGCDVNVTNVLTKTVANSKQEFHFIKSCFHCVPLPFQSMQLTHKHYVFCVHVIYYVSLKPILYDFLRLRSLL